MGIDWTWEVRERYPVSGLHILLINQISCKCIPFAKITARAGVSGLWASEQI